MTVCLYCSKTGSKTSTSACFVAALPTLWLNITGETLPCFTRCMLCIAWPCSEGSVWRVNIKIEHRGQIKRLFNPIIQKAAIQKADAGEHWPLSRFPVAHLLPFPSSHTPLTFSFVSPKPILFLLCILKYLKKPIFDSQPPHFFTHLLWQSCL